MASNLLFFIVIYCAGHAPQVNMASDSVVSYEFLGKTPRDDFNNRMTNTLLRYKKEMKIYKNDWDWFDHHSCKTHGRNCPSGALEIKKHAAVNELVYSKDNLESYIVNQLFDFPLSIKTEIRAAGTKKGVKFDEKYVKEYSVGGTISRTFHFVAWYIDETNQTFTIFNFMVKIEKYAGSDHHFLAEYWDGNDQRIENALRYHIGNLLKEQFPQISFENEDVSGDEPVMKEWTWPDLYDILNCVFLSFHDFIFEIFELLCGCVRFFKF